MTQVFFEITNRFYVTVVSDKIVVDSVDFALENCFNDILHYLSGIDIDEAILMLPLQYTLSRPKSSCSPYDAIVNGHTYKCVMQQNDVIKLNLLMEKLKVKKTIGMDKFGFINLLAQKDGIYTENLGGVNFYYKKIKSKSSFSYSKEVPLDIPVMDVSTLWHPKLLSEFANKDVLVYEDFNYRKHLCLCGFYLSGFAAVYLFDFSLLYLQCVQEKESIISDKEESFHVTQDAKIDKKLDNFDEKSVTKSKTIVHSKSSKKNLFIGSLNVAAAFALTVLTAFSLFCKKDVTYLEAQTSNKEVTIENEKARDEILNKVSINSISNMQIDKIEQIMAIKLKSNKATLGEVKVTWEGNMECVYYIADLDYANELMEKLSEVTPVASSDYEGTVQIDNSVRYKICYVFKTTA